MPRNFAGRELTIRPPTFRTPHRTGLCRCVCFRHHHLDHGRPAEDSLPLHDARLDFVLCWPHHKPCVHLFQALFLLIISSLECHSCVKLRTNAFSSCSARTVTPAPVCLASAVSILTRGAKSNRSYFHSTASNTLVSSSSQWARKSTRRLPSQTPLLTTTSFSRTATAVCLRPSRG